VKKNQKNYRDSKKFLLYDNYQSDVSSNENSYSNNLNQALIVESETTDNESARKNNELISENNNDISSDNLNHIDEDGFFEFENDLKSNYYNLRKKNELLYENAPITISEFNTLFMACVDRLSLADTHCDLLLDFVRVIIPKSNELANSYYMVQKSRKNDLSLNFKVFKLCHMCQSKISFKKCSNETCLSNNQIKKKYIEVVVSNISSQIEEIISNNYGSITKYQSM